MPARRRRSALVLALAVILGLVLSAAAGLWFAGDRGVLGAGVRDRNVTLPDRNALPPPPPPPVGGQGLDGLDTATPAGAGSAATCDGPAGPVVCVQWQRADDAPAAPPAASQVVGSVLLSVTDEGRVLASDVFGGTSRWHRDHGVGARIWPAIGGTMPVTDREGTKLLSVSRGTLLGTFDEVVEQADAHGSWMLVAGPTEVSARLVTSRQGPHDRAWTHDLAPDARVWLTSAGAYLDDGAGELRALHSNTGRERWRLQLEGPVTHVLRTREGTAIGVGGPSPALVTVTRGGEVLGVQTLPAPAARLVADPTGRVVAAITEGPDDAVLHVVDAETGARRLSMPLGAGDAVAPALRPGLIAVAMRSPSPVLLVLHDSGLVAMRRTLEHPPDQVVLPSGRTVVALAGSQASAWSLVTGEQRWTVELGADARLVDSRSLLVESAAGLTSLVAEP